MIRRVSLLVLALAVLIPGRSVASEPLRLVENLRHESVMLPASAPERNRLALISYAAVVDEDGGIGLLLLYDDTQTKREIDYIELYAATGDLLLVSWCDRFGVCQVAVDRGLLRDEEPGIEGVFITIADGTQL